MAYLAVAICTGEIRNCASYALTRVFELDNRPISIGSSGVHASSELNDIASDPVCNIDIFQICLPLKFKIVFRQSYLFIIQLSNVHICFFCPEFIACFNNRSIAIFDMIIYSDFNNSFIREFILNDNAFLSTPFVLLLSWDHFRDPLPNLSTDDVGSKYKLVFKFFALFIFSRDMFD